MIRNPVVAGGFYPGAQKVLEEQVKAFLGNVNMEEKFKDILGIISPHAGYVYSGQCAAYGFKALQQKDFETAVIIAPSHRFGNFKYSVGDFEEYVTPIGKIKVNKELTKQLLEYDEFDFFPLAHNSEHSLEVQVPFIQYLNPRARILPIMVASLEIDRLIQAGKEIGDCLKTQPSVLMVASTDMSHYIEAGTAEKEDNRAIEKISALDPEGLYEVVVERRISMCGMSATVIMLKAALEAGATRTEMVEYTHSGKVSGDYNQVVAYLSMIVY